MLSSLVENINSGKIAPSKTDWQGNMILDENSSPRDRAKAALMSVKTTNVPGVGELGVDIEGAAKGVLMAQENSREERKMSMLEEQQSWKRHDVEREQAIQLGMSQAAQQGGYEGVIKYLQNADPVRAIQFHELKLGLDQSMMKTDVMKAQSQTKIAEAMAEGYGVIGKMGLALLKADPQDRQNMYKQMLPMIKQVNPDAPTSLNDKAISMFMLSAAQATPQNQLFVNQGIAQKATSAMGKNIDDLIRAKALYGEDSPQAQLLQKQIDNNLSMVNSAKIRNMTILANSTRSGEDTLRKEWMAQTKDFNTIQNSYNGVVTSAKQSSDSKLAGASDMAMIYNYMKMLDPTSVIMPGEYANAENTASVPESIRKSYNKIKDGSKLSPEMRNSFLSSAKSLYESRTQSYTQMKGEFMGVIQNRGYDPRNIMIERKLDQQQQGPQQEQQQPQNPFADLIPKKAQ